MLKFYNTLGRKLQEFKPLHDNEVRMYSCGPTVYYYPHIGNYRAFILVDLLRRYLKYKGFNLKHVMNITDVDDKTIRDSKKEGKTLNFCARKCEKNLLKLNRKPRETTGTEICHKEKKTGEKK